MVTHVTDILAAMRTAHNLCDRGRVVYKTLSCCSRPGVHGLKRLRLTPKLLGRGRLFSDGSVMAV